MTKIYNHTAMLLVGSLLLGGCSGNETNKQDTTYITNTQNTNTTIEDNVTDTNTTQQITTYVDNNVTITPQSVDTNETQTEDNNNSHDDNEIQTTPTNEVDTIQQDTNTTKPTEQNITQETTRPEDNATTIPANEEEVVLEDTNSTTQVEDNTTQTKDIKVIISDIPTQRIKYSYITLKAQSDTNVTLKVLNQTLQQEQNRTIYTKGYKQPNTNEWYFYDIPLVVGENNLSVVASDSYIKKIHISSDANETLPLRVQSDTYRGIQELNATLKIDTLVDVDEVYWDIDGDGVIDQKVKPTTYQEQNLTIYTSSLPTHYTKEGRYHPRVTLQTKDGLFFSSQDVALSLDVVRDKDQKDPKGAEPIDIAKAFVKALIEDDRESVERLSGYSANLLAFIYEDGASLERAKRLAREIDPDSWKQTYRSNGSIEVTAEANDDQYGKIPITIEVMYAYGDGAGSGRLLYVSDVY